MKDYMPHGHCYFWEERILWPMVAGEIMHVIAYTGLAILIFVACLRPLHNAPMWIKPFLFLFGCFIMTCGITHLIGVITIWEPHYFIQANWMLLSGMVSMFTLVVVAKRWGEIKTALGAGKILGKWGRTWNSRRNQ